MYGQWMDTFAQIKFMGRNFRILMLETGNFSNTEPKKTDVSSKQNQTDE